MSKVVDFLVEAKVFYIATVEEDQPRVRPFGGTMEFNSRVYLTTSKEKKVFKQLVKNPKIELSGITKGQWIRITGNAVVDETVDAKKAMLEANPYLKNRYSEDYGKLAVFYIDKMKAVVYSNIDEYVELEN